MDSATPYSVCFYERKKKLLFVNTERASIQQYKAIPQKFRMTDVKSKLERIQFMLPIS